MASFIILINFHNSCADIKLLTYVATVFRNASTREFKRFFLLPSPYFPALHNTRVYRDISVGIVIRLSDRRRGIAVRFPAALSDLSSLTKRVDRF